ncbi:protein of unknown function [Methylocaldum szegediense]|uniref:Uncharacterized protein n=1 Tax=Methylocaldum szegediense TaxID=73780 RepID=A0ABN8X660_9GAMM|nr:protein of unknown function [Methylocaldum szegediense]
MIERFTYQQYHRPLIFETLRKFADQAGITFLKTDPLIDVDPLLQPRRNRFEKNNRVVPDANAWY